MRLVIAVFSTVTALIFSASPASAHNTLVSSNPENGAMMASAPLQWVLTFDKSVPLSSASGEVVKSDGVRVALAVPRHGTSDNIIVFDFPPSLSGSSTARWRLIGTDGHVISGRVSFSVD
jgi:copper transport protein